MEQPKVRQQILRIFFLAALLPILVFGIFAVFQVRRQMTEHYRSQVKAEGLRINSILFDITTSLYTSSESILDAKKCMELFSTTSLSETDLQYWNDINDALDTFHKNTAAITTLCIYTNNPHVPDSDFIRTLSSYDEEPWFQSLKNGWCTWTYLVSTPDCNTDNLSLIRRIGVPSHTYSAYLVIRLDDNYLRNRMEQTDYRILTTVDNGPCFYATDRSLLQSRMTFPEDFDGGFYQYLGPLSSSGQKVLANIQTFRPYKTDNLFFIQVTDPDAYQNINRITVLYTVLIAVAAIIPTVVILAFSSYFSRRVTTLKTAMHQASLGDYNIIDSFHGDDELKETFEDLKATVQMIHDKEARFYETSINEQKLINRQQQMEFSMLASQINPHFLYNTLETIRMQALAGGNRDVAASIKLLGKSMRYVLENTGTSSVTLTKELDYIRTYLSIQRLRFGDRVNADIRVSPGLDTDTCRLLPLLLQPIVENAIIHGLEGITENGLITISIEPDKEDLLITIADNGSGMDEETLSDLKEHIRHRPSEQTDSIGLYNINKRIHLFYGSQYHMDITSAPGEGTTVTLTLPYTLPASFAEKSTGGTAAQTGKELSSNGK